MNEWRNAARPGQIRAVDVTMGRYLDGESYTALVLPTRYGKSDVMRLSTYLLWADGHAPCALALSPTTFLRNQLGAAVKWQEAALRYRLMLPVKLKTLTKWELRPHANGELFLSATMGLAQHNLDFITDWILAVIDETGRAPLLFIDETHMSSNDNKWGEVATLSAAAGARIVLLTATAERSDGNLIPGFPVEETETQIVKVAHTRPGREPELIEIDLYEGRRSRVKLVAHHETTFKAAWDEGALCHFSRVPYDIDLSEMSDDGATSRVLSEIESTIEARRALSMVIRSQIAISHGAHSFVWNLHTMRNQLADAAGIVFCGNDQFMDEEQDREFNQHAKKIEKAVHAEDASLRVVIATSAEGDGARALEQFAAGLGDVLIVKQMASLGIDIGRLKVGWDLSPVRTPASCIQRMMRIATPHHGMKLCVWITPDDIISRGYFDSLIDRQGGAAVTHDLELISTTEKLREEHTRSFFTVDDATLADFQDTKENYAAKEEWRSVELVLNAYPELLSFMSHAEVARRFPLMDLSPRADSAVEPPTISDTGRQAETKRALINELARDVATHHLGSAQYTPDAFRVMIRQVYTETYRAVGVERGIELGKLSDLGTLTAIEMSLREQLRTLTGDMASGL